MIKKTFTIVITLIIALIGYNKIDKVKASEDNNAIFLSNIEKLNILAKEYKKNNDTLNTEAELCLQYIRRNRYNNESWAATAGDINADFTDNYVKQSPYASDLENYQFKAIIDPITGYEIDFVHLSATLNTMIYQQSISNYLSSFAGYAGDLTTLMAQVIRLDNENIEGKPINYDELLTYAKNLIETTNKEFKSTFDMEDFIADLDAVILYSINNFNDSSEELQLYNALNNYYSQVSSNLNNRKSNFISSLSQTNDSLKNYLEDVIGGNKIALTLLKTILKSEHDGDLLIERYDKKNYDSNHNYYVDIVNEAFIFHLTNNTVTKPIEKNYCNDNLIYNGTVQILTKPINYGFIFNNNEQIDALSYDVIAKLLDNYKWSDGSTEDIVITCTINKLNPIITIDTKDFILEETRTITLNLTSNIKGIFTISIDDNNIANIDKLTIETIEDINNTITITGLQEGSSILNINFIPEDSSNYNEVNNKYPITIIKRNKLNDELTIAPNTENTFIIFAWIIGIISIMYSLWNIKKI